MTSRLAIESVTIGHQIEACRYTGCDGFPASRVFSPIAVRTTCGREFFLPQGVFCVDEDGFGGYVARYEVTDAAMDKIRRAGSIDPAHWVELDQTPLEVRFEEYAIEEQMERAGYGHAGWGW